MVALHAGEMRANQNLRYPSMRLSATLLKKGRQGQVWGEAKIPIHLRRKGMTAPAALFDDFLH